jgi:hypothetical protein
VISIDVLFIFEEIVIKDLFPICVKKFFHFCLGVTSEVSTVCEWYFHWLGYYHRLLKQSMVITVMWSASYNPYERGHWLTTIDRLLLALVKQG